MSTRHNIDWGEGGVGHEREGVVYRYLKRRRSVDSGGPVCKQCKPEIQKYLLPAIQVSDATFTDLDVYNQKNAKVVVDDNKWEKRRFEALWRQLQSFEVYFQEINQDDSDAVAAIKTDQYHDLKEFKEMFNCTSQEEWERKKLSQKIILIRRRKGNGNETRHV
eukprot:388231-Rhodomonas_salina.2